MGHRLIFTHSFTRRARRLVRQHPELTGQYQRVLALLEADPFHPVLRLHRLKGRLGELHAVSINIRYRITLLIQIRGKTIIPVDIGTHDKVYRD